VHSEWKNRYVILSVESANIFKSGRRETDFGGEGVTPDIRSK
jgi:hypothetical protein